MYSLEFQISHIPGDSVKNEIASLLGLPYSSDGKESTCNAGDSDSIPGSGRSSGEENGNPLRCSYLENPMDREPGVLQSMGLQRVGHD